MRQAATGVIPTLAVATLLALISANATKASMEMDTLVLVGKDCVFFHMCFSAAVLTASDTCVSTCLCQQNLSTQHSPDISPLGLSLFTDIDECAVNNGHCEHNCSNWSGAYSCQCASGYQLDRDGHNCTGKTHFGRNVSIPFTADDEVF